MEKKDGSERERTCDSWVRSRGVKEEEREVGGSDWRRR